MKAQRPLHTPEHGAATSQAIRKPYSIARRLANSLVIAVALVAGLAATLFYLNATRQAERHFNHKADEMIAFLTGTLEPPLWDLNEKSVRVICETFAQNELVAAITVSDPADKVYFATGNQDRPVLIRQGQVWHDGELIGRVELALAKDLIQRNTDALLLPFAVIFALILLTLLLCTRFAIRAFLNRPLEHLDHIVTSYGAGHYDPPFAPLPYLEFRPFGKVLADMGQKIRRQVVALQASEQKYRTIIEKGVEGVFQTTLAGQLIEANPAFARILGYRSPAEAIASITDLGRQLYAEAGERTALLELFEQQDAVTNYEVRFRKKNRDLIWVELHARARRDEQGTLLGVEGFLTDISERKEAQERLRASLQEKECLLQELYHRTKNNMQVIGSMLTLQATHSKQPEVGRVFKEMKNKIDAMALVHGMLYQSQDLSQIDLHDYIYELVERLKQSYAISSSRITIKLRTERLPVLIDTAIPCGLILNELFTNAFKHAFPDGRKGSICIHLTQGAQRMIELSFADDGIGVPSDFDFRNQQSLGLQSIHAIAEHQLQGEICFTGQPGVSCLLRFPNGLYRTRV